MGGERACLLPRVSGKEPRRAVCCPVLLLQTQVGVVPDGFALAQAYRVPARWLTPSQKVLGQNRSLRHHEHGRVFFLYHVSAWLGRVKLGICGRKVGYNRR